VAGTNAAAFKLALVGALQAAPGLVGVQVVYSQANQRTVLREWVSLGEVKFVHTRTGTHGMTRRTRTELLTVEALIQVRQMGVLPEVADQRAVVIGTVLEELLADDPTVGGVVPKGLYGIVAGGDLAHVADDDGVYSQLTYNLEFTSYGIQ
jgi:hypothetical protein